MADLSMDMLRERLSVLALQGHKILAKFAAAYYPEHYPKWAGEVDVVLRALFPGHDVTTDTVRGDWLRLRAKIDPGNVTTYSHFFREQVALVDTISENWSLCASPATAGDVLSTQCWFHRRQVSARVSEAFVLMPFRPEDDADAIYDSINAAMSKLQTSNGDLFVAKRADDLHGQDVMQDIYEGILASRCVIVETTGLNPNVFLELGMALSFGKTVILITRDPLETIPFDLRRFRHFEFTQSDDGLRRTESKLVTALKELVGAVERPVSLFGRRARGGGGGIFVDRVSVPSVAEGTR